MALIRLPDNGQSFELDDEDVKDDAGLRQMLASVYPEIGNAKINRSTDKKTGRVTIDIVKQAGTKGVDVADVGIEPVQAVQAAFSFDDVDPAVRDAVRAETAQIKMLMSRTVGDIITIGKKLIDVKGKLKHGQFQAWLRDKIMLSADSAGNFMRVAERFGNTPLATHLAASVLYELARPSTPESAREEVLGLVEQGEAVSLQAAREIVSEHRAIEAREQGDGGRQLSFAPDPEDVEEDSSAESDAGEEEDGDGQPRERRHREPLTRGPVNIQKVGEVPYQGAPAIEGEVIDPGAGSAPEAVVRTPLVDFQREVIILRVRIMPENTNGDRWVFLSGKVGEEGTAIAESCLIGEMMPMPPALAKLMGELANGGPENPVAMVGDGSL